LTQKELAEKINASVTTICEIENEKHKPNCDCLEQISLVFNINLYWLLFGEGEMFLDPVTLVMNQAGDFSSYKEVRKFLHYFRNSSIIRYSTLANFCTLMVQQKQNIEKEILENAAEPCHDKSGGCQIF
jgi:DNA-binding XRE family transcriptional regulator